MTLATDLPDERSRAAAASNARWRWRFAALAVVVPLLLGGLFYRQTLRLRALADHGQSTSATVVERRGGGAYYRYFVDGRAYDWNVRLADAPYALGEVFPITYLPEDPALNRPVWPYTAATYAAERPVAPLVAVPVGSFVFFALAALACHRALLRSRAGLASTARAPVSPVLSGRIVAALVLLAVLSANLAGDVRAVHATLWGATVAGLPTTAVVTAAQVVLFAPFFWVFPALMRIVQSLIDRGVPLGQGAFARAVVTAGPELRRERNVVMAGGVYFTVITGLWIAYAAWRGV